MHKLFVKILCRIKSVLLIKERKFDISVFQSYNKRNQYAYNKELS